MHDWAQKLALYVNLRRESIFLKYRVCKPTVTDYLQDQKTPVQVALAIDDL